MAKFSESIKSIFIELEKFLVETLKTEKLSSSTNKHKKQILDKLFEIQQEYPQLQSAIINEPSSMKEAGHLPKPAASSSVINDNKDDSPMTGGAAGNEEDDGPYSESILLVPAAELTQIIKSGFLEKKRKKEKVILKPFQKRWCILTGNTFYYYEKQTDKRQVGAFVITGYIFRESPQLVKEAAKKELAFELVCPGKRTYQFLASSKDDFQAWKNVLENAATTNAEYEQDSIYDGIEECNIFPAKEILQEELYDDTGDVANELYDDADIIHTKVANSEGVSAKKPPLPVPSSKQFQVEVEAETDDIYDDIGNSLDEKIEIPENDYENMYYGMFDCKGDNDNELSFKKGDIIHILNKDYDSKSWWIGMADGKVGLVPKEFLMEAYEQIN